MTPTAARRLLGPAPAALLVAVALSIAPAPGAERRVESLAELDAAIAARGLDPERILHPMAMDDEMRAWIDGRIPEGTPEERLNSLLAVLVDPDGFNLRYASSATYTARQAFDRREGNCLAFTHLFVALARELGLDVYYVEVRRSRSFEQEGDLVVVWEHVTAAFGPASRRVTLEFNLAPPAASRSTRRLSDLTAVAMHYSNRGAELLRAGQRLEAIDWLETAVALDPQWSPAWLNLGVARRRSGDLAGAEEAYRLAIDADPEALQAYFNLAGLLRARGDRDAAHDLLELLEREDNRDPFINLALGDESLTGGQAAEARRFYRRAVNFAPEVAEPRAALGLLELAQGHPRKARRLFVKAGRLRGQGPRYESLRKALGTQGGNEPGG